METEVDNGWPVLCMSAAQKTTRAAVNKTTLQKLSTTERGNKQWKSATVRLYIPLVRGDNGNVREETKDGFF